MFLSKKKERKLLDPALSVRQTGKSKFKLKTAYSCGRILTDNIQIGSNRNIWRYLPLIIGLALIVFLIFIIFLSDVFKIKYIDVIREDLLTDSAQVRDSLQEYFGQNILFVSKREISQTINDKFPIVAGVKVERVFPNTLRLELISYPSVANIKFLVNSKSVGDDLSGQIEQKGLLNKKGYVVAIGKENLQLPSIFLVDQDQEVFVYEQAIKTAHLEFILDTLKIIDEKLHLKIKKIEYYKYGREVHFIIEKGFVLWLDFEDTPYNQLEKLIKEINLFDLENDPPSYFDLRIKNRLIYK
jgi:hypothetical protein